MGFFRLMAVGVVLVVLVGSILGMACTGAKGEQGADGVGIQSIANNTDGTLTIYLTNGQSYTTGDLTGPQGVKGDTGPQGVEGIQGPRGLPGVGIAWQGEWSDTLTYRKHDAVGYQGSSYVSKQESNANHVPTDTNWWDLWVEKGDTGATGADGADGAPGIDGQDGAPGPNMIVAMGVVNGDGTLASGYNVTGTDWNDTYAFYDIILAVPYSDDNMVTLVTSMTFGIDEYRYKDNGAAGHLEVRFYDLAPNNTQSDFSFVVLRTTP